MARFDLSDAEWRLIEPLLPNKPRGVARVDDRRVLNGIFYVLRTGSPWRDLPERYGPYTTVYNRFNRWARAGVWVRVFETLAAKSPHSMALIDSSIIRAHQHAAGGKRGRGSRHRPFSWRTEHQDQRRRRREWPAGAAHADRRASPRSAGRAATARRSQMPPCRRRPRLRRRRPARADPRRRGQAPYPIDQPAPGPSLGQSPHLPPAQPRRALLQQAQALQAHRHPLRQARPQLPRRRRPRFSQAVDQNL